MEKRHLHPLLQFLYPSAISNAIAEIRCIRFLPDDAALAVTSRHKLRQVVSSLPSLPSANLPMTWHCIALSVFLYQSAPWAFQQSSKVLLGNCLGVVCVIKWQCLKSTFEWQCLKPETCSLETDPSSLPKARATCYTYARWCSLFPTMWSDQVRFSNWLESHFIEGVGNLTRCDLYVAHMHSIQCGDPSFL